MLNYIVNLIKALNANSKPSQIAASFSIGLLLGFMPKNNLLWYVVFIFFAFVRFYKPAYLIMIGVGSIFASFLDPLFDTLGYAVLTIGKLQGFYGWLLDVPFVGFTKFNNTIVTGSLVFGLICFIPLFVLMIFAIKAWRKYVAPKFIDSKILKTLYKLPLLEKIASKI